MNAYTLIVVFIVVAFIISVILIVYYDSKFKFLTPTVVLGPIIAIFLSGLIGYACFLRKILFYPNFVLTLVGGFTMMNSMTLAYFARKNNFLHSTILLILVGLGWSVSGMALSYFVLSENDLGACLFTGIAFAISIGFLSWFDSKVKLIK